MRPCFLSRSSDSYAAPTPVSKSGRRRVVLHDVVVPIEHPHVAVGADLGHDRRRPFVAAGDQVHRARRAIAGAVAFEHEHADQVARRLADERRAVPPLLRIGARRVERVPGAGRVGAEIIDLPHLVGDGREPRACRRSCAACRPTSRERARSSGSAIGMNTLGLPLAVEPKIKPFFADAQAPGVVVRRAQELELGDARRIVFASSRKRKKPWRNVGHVVLDCPRNRRNSGVDAL